MTENRIYHQGIPIDNLDYQEAVNQAVFFATSPQPRHIITLEVDGYYEATHNLKYRKILNDAAMVVPNSIGLTYLSLVVGPRLKRATGHNLCPKIINAIMEKNQRVVLVGSSPDNRTAAVKCLKEKYKTKNIVQIPGEYNYSNQADTRYLQEELDRMSANFTVLAFNQLQSEMWIDTNIIKPNVGRGLIGNFGQTIDHIAGVRPVPPYFIDRLGLNWMYMLPSRSPTRRKQFFEECVKLAELICNSTKSERINSE